MSRRLLVINVALGIVSVVLAVGIVRTLLAKRPLPPAVAAKPVSAPAPEAVAPAGDVGPGAFGVISARNLFNPNRSETTAVAVAAPVAKPILYGVVVDGAKSRAFLEDPTVKRVAGYSVGDAVGGGTIQKISDDRVVIVRPEGPVEILLQDPSKPRPAPPAAAPQAGPPQARAPQPGPAQPGPAQAATEQPGLALPGPTLPGPTLPGPALPGSIQAGSPPNAGPPAALQRRQRMPLQRQPNQ